MTRIDVYSPDSTSLDDPWTVSGDLRLNDDDEANYLAADALRDRFPSVTLDPEFSCFFAYATCETAANDLAKAVGAWVATRNVPAPRTEEEAEAREVTIKVSVSEYDLIMQAVGRMAAHPEAAALYSRLLGPAVEDEQPEPVGCECELDWNCPLHQGQFTAIERINDAYAEEDYPF